MWWQSLQEAAVVFYSQDIVEFIPSVAIKTVFASCSSILYVRKTTKPLHFRKIYLHTHLGVSAYSLRRLSHRGVFLAHHLETNSRHVTERDFVLWRSSVSSSFSVEWKFFFSHDINFFLNRSYQSLTNTLSWEKSCLLLSKCSPFPNEYSRLIYLF